MLVCCRDRYETQKMCDEAVDYFLAALKFITAWFVASEIINKRLITLSADDNVLYIIKILVMSYFL